MWWKNIGLAISVLAMAYFFMRTLRMTDEKSMTKAIRQGWKNALVRLIGLFTAFLVTTLAIRLIFDRTLKESTFDAFSLLFFLFFMSFAVGWFLGENEKGRIVLDCGGHPTKGKVYLHTVFWSYFTALLIVSRLAAFLTDSNELPDDGASTYIILYFLLGISSRLQILETGIWNHGVLLKWDRIESYEWQGVENRTLVLKINRNLPSRILFWGNELLRVPLEHRDAVDDLLQKNVSMSHTGDEPDLLADSSS